MAGRFGPAVHGKMLGRRDDAIVFRVVTLHACDKCHAHARRQEGILSKGFLPASPARIAKDVDVRSPEVEAFKDIAVPVTQTLTCLIRPSVPITMAMRWIASASKVAASAVGSENSVVPFWQRRADASLHQS